MIASSFAGPNDKRLPPAVRRMAKPLRELWVETFNAGAGNESAAYKLAWKNVRAAIASKETPGIDEVFVGQETQEATMPWKVVEEDGAYCVYQMNDDGSLADKLKCYDDQGEALAYQRALYANVEEKAGPAGDVDRLKALAGDQVTLAGQAEKRRFDESMVERHPKGDERGGQFAPKDGAGGGGKGGSGDVVIGEVTQPVGGSGAYFREVAIFNASELTERAFRDYGAKTSKSGARLDVVFRGNTGSAVGIGDDALIKQILHLSGHKRFPEAFPYNDDEEKDNLFGSYRPFGGASTKEAAADLPTLVSFKAFDQPDGRTRWVLTSSGGFEDRDGEVVSTDFLRSCVAVADRSKERGPLLIFHVPGAKIGTCDYQAVVGEPGFLLESGLFDDSEAGRRAASYYKAHAKETGASIKFLYANLSQDGVYAPPGVILERSLMRRERAAFPWSGLQLSEVNEMAKISREKRDELEAVLGEELAVSILDQLDANAEALKQAGVRAKAATPEDGDEDEMDDETTEAAATPEVEAEVPVPEDEDEDEMEKAAKAAPPVEGGEYELVLTEDALNAVAEKAASAISAQLDQLAGQLRAALDDVKTLRTVVEKNAQDVEALKQTDEAKVAEKVANLPRATVRRLQAGEYRATQSKEAEEAKAGDDPMADDYLARLKRTVHD